MIGKNTEEIVRVEIMEAETCLNHIDNMPPGYAGGVILLIQIERSYIIVAAIIGLGFGFGLRNGSRRWLRILDSRPDFRGRVP